MHETPGDVKASKETGKTQQRLGDSVRLLFSTACQPCGRWSLDKNPLPQVAIGGRSTAARTFFREASRFSRSRTCVLLKSTPKLDRRPAPESLEQQLSCQRHRLRCWWLRSNVLAVRKSPTRSPLGAMPRSRLASLSTLHAARIVRSSVCSLSVPVFVLFGCLATS